MPEATLVWSQRALRPSRSTTAVTLNGAYWMALRYTLIRSFAGNWSAEVFSGHAVRGPPLQLQPRARAELLVIDAAVRLSDLRSPPGSRPELLRGNRRGQHSIRINDLWRICFVWRDGEASNVEITDYH